MPPSPRHLAILGSTGSIGTNTLDVVRSAPDRLKPLAISAHSNFQLLRQQALEFEPRWIVASDADAGRAYDWGDLGDTEVLFGPEGLDQVAREAVIDTIVAAIVGSAGLQSTWAAIECGKDIALANKETLVVAGPLVRDLARKTGSQLIPIDSEHSALFQAAQAGRMDEAVRFILTASGGPFRDHSLAELRKVTVEQALAHPTWDMGPKVTIDSATMMNKALEIIEARWLFDIEIEKIGVVIHPQSIMHSMVEFVDGSVIGQLSPPDMRLPIQYALTYPDRIEGPSSKMDWERTMQLDFIPPDSERFPALDLGREVAAVGGTAGAVVNAANEAAVSAFLAGQIPFTEIVAANRAVLENHQFDANPSLETLLELDRWARKELDKWITC